MAEEARVEFRRESFLGCLVLSPERETRRCAACVASDPAEKSHDREK